MMHTTLRTQHSKCAIFHNIYATVSTLLLWTTVHTSQECVKKVGARGPDAVTITTAWWIPAAPDRGAQISYVITSAASWVLVGEEGRKLYSAEEREAFSICVQLSPGKVGLKKCARNWKQTIISTSLRRYINYARPRDKCESSGSTFGRPES